MGIEPTLAAWEAAVLPLNYTRGLQRILGPAGDRGQSPIGGIAHTMRPEKEAGRSSPGTTARDVMA